MSDSQAPVPSKPGRGRSARLPLSLPWFCSTSAPFFLAFFAHAALAALFHRHVLASPSTLLLAGDSSGGYNAWLFWWQSFALKNGLSLFFTPMVMYPAGVPMFPHAPINEAPALLLQLFASPYFCTNLFLISNYVLAGVAAFWLLFRLTENGWAAFAGSLAYAYSAYTIVQHTKGHLIETNLFMNPLLVLAGWRFLQKPSGRRAALMGLALIGVVASGPYVAFSFGFIFTVGCLIYSAVRRWPVPFNRMTVRYMAAAVSVAGLFGAIVYSPLIRHAGEWKGGASFFPLYAVSFFVGPPWPSPWFEKIRPFDASFPFLETGMGYLGVGTLAVLAYGVWTQRRNRTFQFWLWMAVFSAVLALGPVLLVAPGWHTRLPLPYAVFQWIPMLADFRVSGRIMMTATLSVSVLSALALAHLFRKRAVWVQAGVSCALLVALVFEFNLLSLDKGAVPSGPTPVTERLRNDPTPGAVLELPLSYNGRLGDIYVYAQSYMMMQPHHGRPLVLGYPSRYLEGAFDFTDGTPVVYELTHPWVLKELDTESQLAARRRFLRENGSAILRQAGIRYVVYHPSLPAYEPEVNERLARWIEALFGPALVTSPDGTRLYTVHERDPNA